MKNQILARLRAILNEYTETQVTEDSRLADDLGLDSFYLLHFLSDVEDAFQLSLSAEEFEDFFTVKDVVDYVLHHPKSNSDS